METRTPYKEQTRPFTKGHGLKISGLVGFQGLSMFELWPCLLVIGDWGSQLLLDTGTCCELVVVANGSTIICIV